MSQILREDYVLAATHSHLFYARSMVDFCYAAQSSLPAGQVALLMSLEHKKAVFCGILDTVVKNYTPLSLPRYEHLVSPYTVELERMTARMLGVEAAGVESALGVLRAIKNPPVTVGRLPQIYDALRSCDRLAADESAALAEIISEITDKSLKRELYSSLPQYMAAYFLRMIAQYRSALEDFSALTITPQPISRHLVFLRNNICPFSDEETQTALARLISAPILHAQIQEYAFLVDKLCVKIISTQSPIVVLPVLIDHFYRYACVLNAQ